MRKAILLVLAIGIFLWQPQTVYADDMPDEFLSLEKLEDLLKTGSVEAYFKTVPKGQEIKHYDILIEGIYKEPGLKIIIFRTKSQIAAGMSGSPVYLKKGKLKGKLVGAVAYRFNNFAKVSWGGISPIVLMHKDQSLRNDANAKQNLTAGLPRSFFYENKLFEPVALGNKLLLGYLLKNYDTNAVAAGFLEKNKFVFSVRQTQPAQSAQIIPPKAKDMSGLLKPGMPIVVDLASWLDQGGEESSISAVGTITYVDKSSGRIYAFGHPFLWAKRVKYAFRSCKIINTIPSDENSFKLSGENSEVIGLIDFDSDYGIYSKISSEGLDNLPTFNLDLQREKQTYGKFKITVADHHAFTPLIASIALSLVGQTNDAPLPQELSTTELTAHLDIKDFGPIDFNQTFSSYSTVFGDRKIFKSSYDVAISNFVNIVYAPIFFSRYGFEIEGIWLAANFASGKLSELKFASLPIFPEKVVWGENFTVGVELVSEDNSVVLNKTVEVEVNWEEVQRPVYILSTLEFDKEERKIIWGEILLVDSFLKFKEEAKKIEFFEFYLDAKDFLNKLSNQLEAQKGKLIGWIGLKRKEQEVSGQEKQNLTDGADTHQGEGWHIIQGGLKERKIVRQDKLVVIKIYFPPLPSGYAISPNLNLNRQFEIVLRNEQLPNEP